MTRITVEGHEGFGEAALVDDKWTPPGCLDLHVGNGCEDGMMRLDRAGARVLGTALLAWADGTE